MHDLGQKPLLTEDVFKSIPHPTNILLGDQDDMADRSYSQTVANFLPNGIFELLMETPHPIEKVRLENVMKKFN